MRTFFAGVSKSKGSVQGLSAGASEENEGDALDWGSKSNGGTSVSVVGLVLTYKENMPGLMKDVFGRELTSLAQEQITFTIPLDVLWTQRR